MSKLSIIVAMSNNRVIGVNNHLPWHITEDLKRFKSITMGKPIVMGRKTWQSLEKPLPGRENIVLSRSNSFQGQGCRVFSSMPDVLDHLKNEREIMIIGGAAIYRIALPMATKLYITCVHKDYHGDTFFPEIGAGWQEIDKEHHKKELATPAYTFLEMIKSDCSDNEIYADAPQRT